MVRSRREQVTTAACSSRASVCTDGARRATMIPMHAHVCDGTRKGLVGAQDSEFCQGGQRRREAAGDLIGTQIPAPQPQPIRSPPRHTDRDRLVGAHQREARQGGQPRGEAAGDLIGLQAPAAQPQPSCGTAPTHLQPAEAHGTRRGLVGAQASELRQGGQRRGEAAGDRIGI